MVSAHRSVIRFPSLRRHKASGQAVVTVRGRDIYCGRYGTPEADETYRRVIAELVSSGPEVVRHHGLARPGRGQHAFTPPTRRPITVAELMLAYVEHAERYYQAPSREIEIIRVTCRAVRELFGNVAASEFGARQLKAVRQQWIDRKQARKYINARITRIVRMRRWAAEEALVPASSWHALQSLSGLRAGRSAAKEPERKKPAQEADLPRALTGLPAPVRAILETLWCTGARSGEICSLRTCDIVRDGEPWQYRGARPCGRYRLQMQSRTPRLAFRGPGFIAPLAGRTRRLPALAGRGGGLVAVREIAGPQDCAAADLHLASQSIEPSPRGNLHRDGTCPLDLRWHGGRERCFCLGGVGQHTQRQENR